MCQDDRFARGICARHRCRIFNVYVVLQAWAGTPESATRKLSGSAAFPTSGLLDRSDSRDSPHLQVGDDINTSAFCRTCIGDGNLSEVRTGIWPDGRCLHRCAASKIANAALCGSAITAMRPISSTFMGGM